MVWLSAAQRVRCTTGHPPIECNRTLCDGTGGEDGGNRSSSGIGGGVSRGSDSFGSVSCRSGSGSGQHLSADESRIEAGTPACGDTGANRTGG